MTLGNCAKNEYVKRTGIAFAAVASLIGSGACTHADVEPEPVAQVRSALGSSKPQEIIDSWTKLTQMVSDGNYLLTVDLNAAGRSWTPKAFTGTFDGGDKIISNLTINTTGSGSGFFKSLNGAIVRRVRFTNMTVTDNFMVGGIAATADDSLIELVGVQGTVTAPGAFIAGGLVGSGYGTTINQSFMRGTVSGGYFNTGGLIGNLGSSWDNRGRIYQSYVWADVTADAPPANSYSKTGGIAGLIGSSFVQEVYAVGKVTGRSVVGGIVGELHCSEDSKFVLNHGIYRGDVIDQNRPSGSGGWAGTFGTVSPCPDRFDQNIWDSSRDTSTNWGTYNPVPQKSATNSQLVSPTTVSGGIYNYPDNKFPTAVWDAGSGSQHHALKGMPGGLAIQPRCVNGAGVPYAC